MNDLHRHLSHLYLFQSVARLGSFHAVAKKYGLPRSSVSKKIQQLEDKVGQRLIQRSTRKLNLTESGRDLLAATESLSTLVEDAQRVIDKLESTPSGTIKISCTTIIGQQYIIPIISTLRGLYPNISIDLCLSDHYVDLIEQEVDIAIRIGHLPDSSLVARKIADKRFAWYASPEYLEKNGMPTDPESLNEHRGLVFKNEKYAQDHWTFKHANGDIKTIKITNQLTTDDGRALREMACLGLGVIMIFPFLIKNEIENKQLVPILTDWEHPDRQPINLVCLGRNYRSRASTSVWDILSKNLQEAFIDA
ncbi:LysR family transcriptional regulator [uncultured Psychromonas sp.]|uniref:LysR family transcriptional regulator n=1 Tax=uncultured Psychromonas sp. TaxID=173974 RepID=UPI002638A0F3|nr:LysR family transcriptional regulator [uncultured Psychromonas sp.]